MTDLIQGFASLTQQLNLTAAATATATSEFNKHADAAARVAAAEQAIADKKFDEQIDKIAAASTKAAQAQNDMALGSVQAAAAWGASLASMDKVTAQAIINNANLSDSFAKAASAALAAADAFGRVAGGLANVDAAASGAQTGLTGVAWAVTHATAPTVTLTQAQNDLIQALAKVSDAGGSSSLWIGHLISQLQDGTLSFDQFQSEINQTLQGLTKLGPVMGNTAAEANALNTILDAFKNSASGGWPGGPTSAPLTYGQGG